ncbi:MAG: PAS domain-containing protein [Thermodesulfobacteriota bacterium]
MSVRKLTKLCFAVLAVSFLAVLALGFLGHRTGMAVAAAPVGVSLGYLIFLVFRRVLRPVELLTHTMRNLHEKGLACPCAPLEAPDGELGELAACCNRLYDGLKEMAAVQDEIFSSMPGPAIRLDREGTVMEINRAAVEHGLRGSLKGKPFTVIVPSSGRAAVKEMLKRACSGEGAALETPISLDDGRETLYLLKAVPLRRNGACSGALLLGADIEQSRRLAEELDSVRSEAKGAEEKLNKTIRDLEDFALMAVRREIKMKEIREKLTEFRKGHESAG